MLGRFGETLSAPKRTGIIAVSSSNLRALPGLLTPSYAYKPFRYPWAYEFWRRQQQVHWMPEEVPLGEDCKDWPAKLNDRERNLLTRSSASSPSPTSR